MVRFEKSVSVLNRNAEFHIGHLRPSVSASQAACACRKTTFYDTETDSCARASCQKAPLFDTRESIGEKSVAHVPGFFGFLLKSGFARKAYRLLQQSDGRSLEKVAARVFVLTRSCM